NSLPGNTQLALTNLNIDTAVIAGGESAVSNGVKDSIDEILVGMGGSDSERWWGASRYETAATVARNGIAAGWGTSAFVGLATGLNFPDALGGGAVCGSTGGVLLLTSGTSLSAEAGSFLSDYSGGILEIRVFGGTGVVTDAVMNAAAAEIQ
nr:cell wall-binding repeat-containing protein [Actinomycetota bacterium]